MPKILIKNVSNIKQNVCTSRQQNTIPVSDSGCATEVKLDILGQAFRRSLFIIFWFLTKC